MKPDPARGRDEAAISLDGGRFGSRSPEQARPRRLGPISESGQSSSSQGEALGKWGAGITRVSRSWGGCQCILGTTESQMPRGITRVTGLQATGLPHRHPCTPTALATARLT